MRPQEAQAIAAMKFKAVLVHRASDIHEMDKWHVVIDGFETSYSKGTGLRSGPKWPYNKTPTIDELVKWQQKSKPVDPTASEVLECLAMDASSWSSTNGLDDFAREYGFENGPPSKAIEAYEACQKAARFFANRGLDPAKFLEGYDSEEAVS